MPITGRKPKPEGQKRNRVKPTHDWTEVLDQPFTGGPKLPRQRPDGKAWPRRTKDWWQTVSTMPHCSLWTDSDWSFALDTAFMAAQYHEGDIKGIAAAFLAREKVMGTTMDFRRDLRIRYVQEESEQEDGSVTAIADYRAMVGG